MTGEGGSVRRWAVALVTAALGALVWFAMGASAGPPGSPDRISDPLHDVNLAVGSPDGSFVKYFDVVLRRSVIVTVDGSTVLTTRPPMETVPLVMDSSPAIIRSSVDLPQPDGPTRTMNSPSAMSRSMPLTASTSPP